jgi:lycopene beta-cyclase
MSQTHFDIAIIGAGAAGLQLAIALHRDAFFSTKKILVLDKDQKDSNDRTWSFWEKGAGKWDHLIEHSWGQSDFHSADRQCSLQLSPYRYKTLRSLQFYDFAKREIVASPNFTWVQDEVKTVEERDVLHIAGANQKYTADLVFDSRIPADFFKNQDPYTRLLQHFRGWLVRTPDDRFDPNNFMMMDFRLRWPGSTSFTYVLPFNEREALVEFTLFTPSLLQQEDYDQMLRRYFKEILAIPQFDILETEQGVIPMSDFPFNRYSTDRQLKIGTAGGWVKPSSGYSFKNCEKNAQLIVDNLKHGRPVGHGLHRSRFRWYDSIFLDVLNRRNDLGPGIFSDMYFKNDIQKIFAFLDEESSIWDDIMMFQKFPKRLFLKSLLHHISR